MNNPYVPPKTEVFDSTDPDAMNYAGFWIRFGAMMIDTILMTIIITIPLLWLLYGEAMWEVAKSPPQDQGIVEIIISYALPIVLTVGFWLKYAATPGKMLFKLKIVDIRTGGNISTMQAIGRYLGYIPSTFILLLGFLWVIWDKRKQGWHDKMAKTAVIREK